MRCVSSKLQTRARILDCGLNDAQPKKLSAVGLHTHGLARIAAAFANGRFKNPGVAAQQGALFAFTQTNVFHAAIVRQAISGQLSGLSL